MSHCRSHQYRSSDCPEGKQPGHPAPGSCTGTQSQQWRKMRGGGRCPAYSQAHPFPSTEISGEDLGSWEVRRTMGRRAEKE